MKLHTQVFLVADDDNSEPQAASGEQLSEQIFEMCQMFSQQRPDLNEFAQGFSISKTVEQMGHEQLVDSVDNLIRKENSASVSLK